jgi:hypothetical protein
MIELRNEMNPTEETTVVLAHAAKFPCEGFENGIACDDDMQLRKSELMTA